MAKAWLVVKKADNRVTGWNRSGAATELPVDTTAEQFIEADQTLLDAHAALELSLRTDGRDFQIFYRNNQLEVDADSRPFVRIVLSKNEVMADGVDSITLTVSVLRANGTVNTGVNVTRKFGTFGKLLKLDFVNGVCVKTLKFNTSGRYEQRSTPEVKIETPVSLEVLE